MNSQPPEGFVEAKLSDPFEIHVGPVWCRAVDGIRHFAFRVDERHTNRRNVLHGGMMLTFADLALGGAAADVADGGIAVTLGMQTQFLKTARQGDTVIVEPRILRRTGALIFVRGDFTVENEVVFTASSIWKVLGGD